MRIRVHASFPYGPAPLPLGGFTAGNSSTFTILAQWTCMPVSEKEFQTSHDFLRWCRDAWHRRWSNKSIKSHDLQVSVCRACSWKCLWKEKYVVLMGLTWNVPSVLQGRFRSDIALLRLPSFSFHPCGHRLKSTECKIRQIWKVSLVSFRKGLSCGTVCHPKQSELLV